MRAQINDPRRVNVFVDHTFALGVSLDTIAKAKLYVGKTISAEEYAQIEQLESADKAFQAALRLLSGRLRSTAEVRKRLERKDFAPDAIAAALDRLAQLELIDDAAFARSWVENRQALRPRSASALRDELRRKGVDPGVVATILSDEALTGDEAESAMALARAALRKYASSPDRHAFARRLGGYLQRRGFGFEVIRPIVDQLWAEVKGNADDLEDDQQEA